MITRAATLASSNPIVLNPGESTTVEGVEPGRSVSAKNLSSDQSATITIKNESKNMAKVEVSP